MADTSMESSAWLGKRLEGADPELLRELVQGVVEQLMAAEAQAICGAEYGQRSEGRVNARNGYRPRPWDTRVGTMELLIPKLRSGSYFPSWLLEPRRRAEKALVSVVAEAYLAGVSTRRVEGLIQQLGIERICKSQVSELCQSLDGVVEEFRQRPLDQGPYPYLWLDALSQRCRDGGRIVNVATVVATAVNRDGHREVLGVDVFTAEDAAAWLGFLRSLVVRGLSGVQLAISDDHLGLKAALAATLPGASWQRCRVHFLRNLMTRVPKSTQTMVATLVRSIFAQPDRAEVLAQHQRVVAQLEKRFPEAASLLAQAKEEILAFAQFPKEHWRQIWSNNPQERLNREIRRRTDVVGIFPNRQAVIRLVGAVLAEQTDEWTVARRYLGLDSLTAVCPDPVDIPADLPVLAEAS